MGWRNTFWRSLKGDNATALRKTFGSLEEHLAFQREPSEPPHGAAWQNVGRGYTVSTVTPATNTMYLTSWFVAEPTVLRELMVVATAGPAGAVTRFGVYASNSKLEPTGLPLVDVSVATASGAGAYSVALASPLRLTPGVYWVGRVAQTAAPTYRSWLPLAWPSITAVWATPALVNATPNAAYYTQTGVSGALPAIGTLNGATAHCPRVWALTSPDTV